MCGIIGVISAATAPPKEQLRKYMETGLVIDSIRGFDSTGLFYWPKKVPEAGWIKNAVDGISFIRSEAVGKITSQTADMHAVIGHNRWATVGEVRTATAHPFHIGNVTMVHNGTVRHGLPQDEDKLGLNVDSEAICWHLNDVSGVEDTAKLVSELRGSYALVWHDKRDSTMNIVRNAQRPLHVAKMKHHDVLLIASEAAQLYYLTQKHSIAIEDICSVQTEVLLKFPRGSIVPEATPLPKSRAPLAMSYSARQRNFGFGSGGGTTSSKAATSTGRRYYKPPVAVPKTTEEEESLKKFGLSKVSLVSMTPVSFHETGWGAKSSLLSVSGYLDDHNVSAIVHGVPQDVVDDNWHDRWSVRPLVAFQEGLVVCAAAHLKGMRPGAEHEPKKSRGTAHDAVKGPGGVYIDRNTWLEMTRGGCTMCEIMLVQPDSVKWEARQPYCAECHEWLEEVILH